MTTEDNTTKPGSNKRGDGNYDTLLAFHIYSLVDHKSLSNTMDVILQHNNVFRALSIPIHELQSMVQEKIKTTINVLEKEKAALRGEKDKEERIHSCLSKLKVTVALYKKKDTRLVYTELAKQNKRENIPIPSPKSDVSVNLFIKMAILERLKHGFTWGSTTSTGFPIKEKGNMFWVDGETLTVDANVDGNGQERARKIELGIKENNNKRIVKKIVNMISQDIDVSSSDMTSITESLLDSTDWMSLTAKESCLMGRCSPYKNGLLDMKELVFLEHRSIATERGGFEVQLGKGGYPLFSSNKYHNYMVSKEDVELLEAVRTVGRYTTGECV